MTAERASLPVGARRLAAAVATLVVFAAVVTGSDGRAQSTNLSTPSVSIGEGGVQVDPRALGLAPPTVPVPPGEPAPPAQALPPTTALPTAPAAPIKLPSSLDEPSLPRVDNGGLARDIAGAVDRAAGESPGALGSLPLTSGSSVGADASTPGRANLVTARLPSRAELAKLPPARRRELIRRTFDTPLRERRLRQLRATIRRYRGCLRALPHRSRRVLELRAGLLGGDPATRRAIGRRIGASPRAVARLERSSLHRLVDAGERGRCVGGSVATTVGGPAGGPGEPTGASSSDGGSSPSPAGEVLADAREGGPSPVIDLGDGEESPAETLLFFLLALLAVLGPLAAVAIASRRRAGHAAALDRLAGERPLLFLDVDGVIVLDPLLAGVPRGRLSRLGLSYVPDRTGALVRELATRFDIVWATGWEQHANTSLLSPLGLREELPVLTFGRRARFGSSKWKIKPVKAYAGNRPAAWLDDNFVASHERWAAHRSAPTLLVRVDSRVGLTPDHVERLMQWADGLAPSRVAEPGADRRLRAG